MRSGVGPKGHLSDLGIDVIHDLPGVGQNLRDHIAVNLKFRVHDQFIEPADASYGQNFLRYTSPHSATQTDMFIRESQFTNEFRMWTGTYVPLGSGELALASADPSVPPLIDFRYLSHPHDRERLREAVQLCLRLARHERFQPIITERLAPLDADLVSNDALDDWLDRSVECAVHVTSTCRMGAPTDPGAVVDQEGRVIGVSGIRVADASIMPRPPRGNTNATTIMIGERIADFMRSEPL
jgi:choline dehydrogenase